MPELSTHPPLARASAAPSPPGPSHPPLAPPQVGLGAWQAAKGEVGAAVKVALEWGYRHIDCAACYGNEAEVGEAFGAFFAKGLPNGRREDVFVTSKLWNSEHAPENVQAACEKTLADLQLKYLDLYLVHWPQNFEHVDGATASFPRNPDNSIKYDLTTTLLQTWAAMERLLELGLVRAIGVSNFNSAQIAELLAGGKIPPAANQIESHPY
eukprot:SAG22_NODE_5174_length_1071_cov_1.158599_1_plen_210_part_01